MSKRTPGRLSNAVWTPPEAVAPLLAHLRPRTRFIEPCAGAGDLVRALAQAGHVCEGATDISPPRGAPAGIRHGFDARTFSYRSWCAPYPPPDCFITNPPWERALLHPIIANLSAQLPAWLLFQSDWKHTEQAAPFLPLLRCEMGIGRVKWIPDSPGSGYENASWYLFDATPGADLRHPPGCLFFNRWSPTPAGYPAGNPGARDV